ncbi:MAG: hypothetical protein CHACPFDD_02821 [Phycisphaerae bacterium]|nr:hypothetical protein [Phycisphaerae bacterium]
MTTTQTRRFAALAAVVASLASAALAQTPMSTAFTYQGYLTDSGAAADGAYDFEFTLYDAVAAGNLIGGPVYGNDLVVSDGLFTATIDFGANPFDGKDLWLEIGVRPGASGGAYTTLSPRQPLTPTAYALYASKTGAAGDADTVDTFHANAVPTANMLLPLDAAGKFPNGVLNCGGGGGLDADLLDGQHGAFFQNASNLNTGTLPDARLSGTYSNALALSSTMNSFTGNGAGLFFLNASALSSGTVPDVRLSSNVALLNAAQTFTANKYFTGWVGIGTTSPGMPLHVKGPSNALRVESTSGSAGVQIISEGTGTVEIWSPGGTDEMRFHVNAADRMTIDTSGHVGIGMAPDPTPQLAVNGTNEGVYGRAAAAGGTTSGGFFTAASTSGRGIYAEATAASGSTVAGLFDAASSSSTGVRAYGGMFGVDAVAEAASGTAYGGYFSAASTSGRGVYGQAVAAGGQCYGGYFLANTGSSLGGALYAENTYDNSYTTAIRAKAKPSANRGIGIEARGGWSGIQAYAEGAGTGERMGVYGLGADTSGTCTGVSGQAIGTGTNRGVYGTASGGSTNWAGYFSGNVNVTGTLSKGGGTFTIDHPLDPANKLLQHSFVESPDMMNIYNGNVVTDDAGYATITLPEWFQALNRDFRYQLTVLDAADSDAFVQVKIVRKIAENQFTIRSSAPRTEVSWQVTGIRQDAFANANRVQVELDKPAAERGLYLHPEAWGLSSELGVDFQVERAPRERQDAPQRE